MGEGRYLDLERWPRRAQYHFFRGYELPFFNICAEVRVTETRAWCRAEGRSFALACWYVCQRVVNDLEEFRYRLRGDRVWVHDRVRVATTILNDDETFQFVYLPWADAFEPFCAWARAAMAPETPERLGDRPEDDAVIHGTTLPWVRFTSVSHPRRLSLKDDAVPKITLGRAVEEGGEVVMPVSVEVHHALMDGLHAARFFERFEQQMATPEAILAGR